MSRDEGPDAGGRRRWRAPLVIRAAIWAGLLVCVVLPVWLTVLGVAGDPRVAWPEALLACPVALALGVGLVRLITAVEIGPDGSLVCRGVLRVFRSHLGRVHGVEMSGPLAQHWRRAILTDVGDVMVAPWLLTADLVEALRPDPDAELARHCTDDPGGGSR